MSFYDQFSAACAKMGVSPTRAGIEAGCSSAAVNRWKNGSMPNRITLQRIADYFGITVDELLSADPTPKQKNTAPGTGNGVNPAQQTLELLIQDMSIEELAELIATASDIKKRRSNSGD